MKKNTTKDGEIDFNNLDYLPLNIGAFVYENNTYTLRKGVECYFGSRGFFCPALQFHLMGEDLNESVWMFSLYLNKMYNHEDKKVRKQIKKLVKHKKTG